MIIINQPQTHSSPLSSPLPPLLFSFINLEPGVPIFWFYHCRLRGSYYWRDSLVLFRTKWMIMYLFVHHLQSLRSLQFGKLAPNLNISFGAISLVSSLESLLRVLLFIIIKKIYRLFDCLGNFITLKLFIRVILVKDFLFLLSFLDVFLSFFNILRYISLC